MTKQAKKKLAKNKKKKAAKQRRRESAVESASASESVITIPAALPVEEEQVRFFIE
jgi:hypothetical protein